MILMCNVGICQQGDLCMWVKLPQRRSIINIPIVLVFNAIYMFYLLHISWGFV